MAALSSSAHKLREMLVFTLLLFTFFQSFGRSHCNEFMVDDMKLNKDQLPVASNVSNVYKSAIEERKYRWIDEVMPYKIDESLKDWKKLIEDTISYLNQMFCGCFYIR